MLLIVDDKIIDPHKTKSMVIMMPGDLQKVVKEDLSQPLVFIEHDLETDKGEFKTWHDDMIEKAKVYYVTKLRKEKETRNAMEQSKR